MKQRIVLTGLLCAALGACGSSDGGALGADASADPPDAGGTPSEPDAAPNDPDLADAIESRVVGRYAVKMVVVSIQEVPILGPTEGTSTSYGLSTIEREGDHFTLTETGCHVESTSSGAVTTTIPDAIPRTTPATTSRLAFARDGQDIIWSRAQTVTLISVDLDDPENDALPTMPDDPRVMDQDGDAQPGVTVQVQGLASGDIYVVQRNRSAYDGDLVTDGELTGLITDRSDQSVIGSTNPVLNQNIATTPHEDPSRSTIVLNRVEGAWDCDRLMSERDAVLP